MVIYGASGHAKVVIEIAEANGYNVEYLVDDNPHLTELLGYEVRRNSGHYDQMVVAIGSGAIRKKIVESVSVGRYVALVHPSAVVSPRAEIGEGTVVMPGAIVQSCTQLGRHTIINSGAVVEHDVIIGDFSHIAPNATVAGNVVVGDESWVGAGAVIKQGVKIGSRVMVGAGAVVISDVPDDVVVVGVPARVINGK